MSTEKMSRRKFVQMAGSAALLGTEALDTIGQARADDVHANLAHFDHIVVLMLENRSFDNMLGYLYEDDPDRRFNGVYGKQLSNPIPHFADRAELGSVPVQRGSSPENPSPDPGEEYPRVNTQIFGTVNPITNRTKGALFMEAPYNLPSSPPVPYMNGFVYDYINNFEATVGRAPKYEEYKVIMECFTPEQVPVLSSLARNFAVCDNWFSSVPTQTFANRSFFHCSRSSGLVLNAPFGDWIKRNNDETIFERLSQNNLSWMVYFDAEDVVPVTGAIHFSRLQKYLPTNFCRMDRFYSDVEKGTLPAYSFIEPRMFRDHNDAHPPAIVGSKLQHSSVLAAEQLIHDIYEAIKKSSSPKGSNFQNTLLIITFDEHGGCYDHVPPPLVSPPDPALKMQGQMGFSFDRLGLRVPTVLVSAWIPPGTVFGKKLDHSSVIRTMSLKWNLGSLTERDRTAGDFAELLSLKKPRQRDHWADTTPRPQPIVAQDTLEMPLNHLQNSIFGTIKQVAQSQGLTLDEAATVGEALLQMKRLIPASIVPKKKK